ncbi:protein of unknown function [Burkholderia multivorans]
MYRAAHGKKKKRAHANRMRPFHRFRA